MISWSINAQLQSAIDRFVNDKSLRHAGVSICIIDVETGKIIAEHQKDLCLIPASSMKVVTTAASLSILGRDYRFKTELLAEGEIKNSILFGNLTLKGGGDPTLGSDRFRETLSLNGLFKKLSKAVQQKGICKITGNIVGDETIYGSETHPPTWQLNDVGNYYGVGAWGLNIHENYYDLYFKQTPKSTLKPRIIKSSPYIPNLLLINEVKSSEDSIDNAYIYGSPYSNLFFIRGSIPAGKGFFSIRGSIPDPPFMAANMLMRTLEANGIRTSKKVKSGFELRREGSRTKGEVIYTHYSPPLWSIVKRTNMESNNLYCEAILRHIGKRMYREGTTFEGTTAVVNFWKNKGLDLDGMRMEDGSGLSARNAISSYHFANILKAAAQDTVIFKDFYNSLPEAGVSGTMANLLRNTRAWGRVRAKTGTLKTVRSFTGYAKKPNGQFIAFSVIVNNHDPKSPIREKMARLMVEMCK